MTLPKKKPQKKPTISKNGENTTEKDRRNSNIELPTFHRTLDTAKIISNLVQRLLYRSDRNLFGYTKKYFNICDKTLEKANNNIQPITKSDNLSNKGNSIITKANDDDSMTENNYNTLTQTLLTNYSGKSKEKNTDTSSKNNDTNVLPVPGSGITRSDTPNNEARGGDTLIDYIGKSDLNGVQGLIKRVQNKNLVVNQPDDVGTTPLETAFSYPLKNEYFKIENIQQIIALLIQYGAKYTDKIGEKYNILNDKHKKSIFKYLNDLQDNSVKTFVRKLQTSSNKFSNVALQQIQNKIKILLSRSDRNLFGYTMKYFNMCEKISGNNELIQIESGNEDKKDSDYSKDIDNSEKASHNNYDNLLDNHVKQFNNNTLNPQDKPKYMNISTITGYNKAPTNEIEEGSNQTNTNIENVNKDNTSVNNDKDVNGDKENKSVENFNLRQNLKKK